MKPRRRLRGETPSIAEARRRPEKSLAQNAAALTSGARVRNIYSAPDDPEGDAREHDPREVDPVVTEASFTKEVSVANEIWFEEKSDL